MTVAKEIAESKVLTPDEELKKLKSGKTFTIEDVNRIGELEKVVYAEQLRSDFEKEVEENKRVISSSVIRSQKIIKQGNAVGMTIISH